MKTFKLVGLRIVRLSSEDKQPEEIDLIDGLIINKEDERKNWLIETLVDQQFHSFFEKELTEKNQLVIYATITKVGNDPAVFQGTVRSIKLIGERLSVLFDGYIILSKMSFAEVVLTDLINKGLEGKTLLNEFKNQLQIRKNMNAMN